MLIVISFNIPFVAKFQKLKLVKTDFSCAPHTIQERTSQHYEKPDAWNMCGNRFVASVQRFLFASAIKCRFDELSRSVWFNMNFLAIPYIVSVSLSLFLSLFPLLHVLQIFPPFFLFYLWAGYGICAQNSGVSKESEIGAGNEWKFRALFFRDDNIRIAGEIRGDATREKSLINF